MRRLENPSVEELEECFNKLSKDKPRDQMEAVMIYYIGHGVEFKGEMHAVLHKGQSGRVKYNLEGKANELAKNRLVHVMFDCNRLIWKNKRTIEESKVSEKT